jgi:hypothetical protein
MKTLIAVLTTTLYETFAICFGQGAIVQPDSNWGYNLNLAPPIGQTFTAIGANISTFGVLLQNYATSPANIRYDLFAGDGTAGPLLSSASFMLAPSSSAGYSDASFRSVTLTAGDTYTVIISTPANDCVIYLEQFVTDSGQPIAGMADYPGGHAIISGQPSPLFDLAFRAEPIPEPESMMLVIVGLGVFVICRKHQGVQIADISDVNA